MINALSRNGLIEREKTISAHLSNQLSACGILLTDFEGMHASYERFIIMSIITSDKRLIPLYHRHCHKTTHRDLMNGPKNKRGASRCYL